MTISVLSGASVALLPDSARWIVVTGSVLAALGSWVSSALGWTPPGPFFLIFAFTLSAAVPTSASRLVWALVLPALSAALAVLIALGGSRLNLRRTGRGAEPPPIRPILPRVDRSRTDPRAVIRFALAPLIAGFLSLALDWGHTYWAMVAAVVPLAAADTTQRLVRASNRLIGTLIGIAVAAAFLALHAHGVAAIVIIVALQFGAELFVTRQHGVALVFITPLALMMGELAREVAVGPLLRDRVLETVLGLAVATALTLLIRDDVATTRQ